MSNEAYTEILEVVAGQFRQHGVVDRVVALARIAATRDRGAMLQYPRPPPRCGRRRIAKAYRKARRRAIAASPKGVIIKQREACTQSFLREPDTELQLCLEISLCGRDRRGTSSSSRLRE
jgi:hypothetical protein